MNEFVIQNARVFRADRPVALGYVHVSDGAIKSTADGEPPASTACDRIDAAGQLLTPGLIDIHTHGIHTHNYDQGPEALTQAAKVLGQYGTTAVVPTLVPSKDGQYLNILSEFTARIDPVTGVSIPGVHVEGPFVAIAGAACDTRDGDCVLLDEILDACNGKAAAMSIAPEVFNVIAVIERLMERGVVPFITHTRASVEQTVAAIDAGACHATHFYDVFPFPPDTDPGVRPVGVVETILGDPRATCDFICDGVHVHPMAIRAAVAAKGPNGVVLITDSSIGAGLPPGRYETPWGYPVTVAAGDAPRIADEAHPMAGALAGSALTMNRGIGNLRRWLDLPDEAIWSMGTANPARVLGLSTKGTIEAGTDADLVLWRESDDCPEAIKTWVCGNVVYESAAGLETCNAPR
jgi:N-acetylglucosamine-6-phosphate deacetylase